MNIRVTDGTANSEQVDLVWKSPTSRQTGVAGEACISKQMQEFMVSSKLVSRDRGSGK